MRSRVRSGGRPKVAVVGAGFSGLLTAIHLLERNADLAVHLIEKADRFGAGRAYATANGAHLLNVRAGNMSAFPGRPDHFADWLAMAGGAAGRDAFASRALCGEYLQGLLRDVLSEDGHAGRLLLEQDEALTVAPGEAGLAVGLAMGRSLEVDAVVLAVGLGPPQRAPGVDAAMAAAPGYIADPWTVDPDALPDGDVLLLGTSLTMVDVALGLARPGRRLLAVSRRGLLPHRHAPTAPAQLPPGPLETPRQAARALRALAAEAGWRSAVDGVRPVTAAIWTSWSPAERRRFLRHLRPWWDIHRHRMAPAVADRIEALRASGGLEARAARIVRIGPAGREVAVELRPKGGARTETLRVAAVVNCMGLSGDITGSPLLRDLAARGRLRPDALRLGADVDDAFRVLDADGRPTPGLYAVGPLTRAARWESVAVPDLRNQTAEVAATVIAYLSLGT